MYDDDDILSEGEEGDDPKEDDEDVPMHCGMRVLRGSGDAIMDQDLVRSETDSEVRGGNKKLPRNPSNAMCWCRHEC